MRTVCTSITTTGSSDWFNGAQNGARHRLSPAGVPRNTSPALSGNDENRQQRGRHEGRAVACAATPIGLATCLRSPASTRFGTPSPANQSTSVRPRAWLRAWATSGAR